MELEGGHRNSVIKRRNPIEFGLVFNDAKEANTIISPEWRAMILPSLHFFFVFFTSSARALAVLLGLGTVPEVEAGLDVSFESDVCFLFKLCSYLCALLLTRPLRAPALSSQSP
ncbi:hypothetical protein EVAR_51287_1 [Eumeta japonica]|uniref:Uncharacterized protein n=1 Tax=Eumeta variegata TaxID=151549 RepID=A0A4C1XRH0_EUMVA|nr:hypothetical protein EVAR_51287_1 [Eumeta japonica]